MKDSIKLLFLIFLALLVSTHSNLSQAKELSPPELEEIKKILLEQINRDRALHKLGPLEYDALASQVGDAHCQEMLKEGYLSHWNRQGLKPYHRYSLAGGSAFISENAFTWEVDPPVEMTKELLTQGVLFAQRQFMEEIPPNDGHRQNILDPHHTAVGIGLVYSPRGFRLTQEFINRHVAINDSFPKPGLTSPFWIEGKPLAGRTLESIALFYEPFPRPMSIKELKATNNCNLPAIRRNLFRKLSGNYQYSDGSKGEIEVGEDGTFKAPITFWKGAGIYTVVVWIKQATGKISPATSISLFVR